MAQLTTLAAAAAPNVLIIGGGLTGAATSRALRRLLPEGNIVVWEALNVLGGRFHTEVTGDGGACDTGAQYVTVTDDATIAAKHAPIYAELTSRGVLAPMQGRIEGGRTADGAGANYVAPRGLSSVVAHLFTSAGVEPICARRAVQLTTSRGDEMSRTVWEARTADGQCELFDGVVLTQPIPQMLALLDAGEPAAWLPAVSSTAAGESTVTTSMLSRAQMEGIQYSSRYALTLFFPPSAVETFASHIDWVARYIGKAEDDAIVYIGFDSAKRRPEELSLPLSLIVHTSVPYGIRRIKEGATEADVASDLLSRVQKLLPWLPAAQSRLLRTWSISQVLRVEY